MHKAIVQQFLRNGKTATSEKIILKGVKLLQKTLRKDYKKIIKIAVINLTSLIRIKQLKRKQFRLKEFPYITANKIRTTLALKHLFWNLPKRTNTKIENNLMREFVQASQKNTILEEKRKNIYEYSFLKKKYSHYRWF